MSKSMNELEANIRDSAPLDERLQRCIKIVGMMCKEGRPPKMSIPVRLADEDVFMTTTLRDALEALNRPTGRGE